MTRYSKESLKFEMARQRRVWRRKIVAGFAGAVVLITALVLMVPALSMTLESQPAGVDRNTYVAGMANLASHPAQSFEQEVKDAFGNTKLTVTVKAPDGALPPNSAMKVVPVTDNEVLDAAKQEAAAQTPMTADAARTLAVDIAFYDEEGNEVEPLCDVDVTMASHVIAVQDDVAVVHVDDQSNAEVVATQEVSADDEQVVFAANKFSVYAIVYTVDFEYEINGAKYGFTLKGEDAVSLRALVEALHLADGFSANDLGGDKTEADASGEEGVATGGASDDEADKAPDSEAVRDTDGEVGADVEANAEDATEDDATVAEPPSSYESSNSVGEYVDVTSDEVLELESDTQGNDKGLDAFMASVESVDFTDPTLLAVCAVEEDATLRDLKYKYQFLQEYDIWRNESTLHELNAKQFKAGDWALVSLQPFNTEEALTITLKTGEKIVVKVTDAQDANMKPDGVTVDTISNPAGTTIDLFDYWVDDEKRFADARLAWPGFQSAGTDGAGLKWDDPLRGTTGNNIGINARTDDSAHGHALKFSPAYSHTVYDGAINNWTQETSDNYGGATPTTGLNSYTLDADPCQGIVENRLYDGYPKLTNAPDTKGTNGESLQYLFDPTYDHAGKASYSDVNKLLYVDKDGYYTYDSRDYKADFDGSSKEFTLTEQTDTDTERRGFWPFGTSIYWSGMHVNAQFSIPADGKVLNPQGVYKPMQFEFSGDDDTWIYIDGVLVGDGGGVHNRTEIDINFQTGKVTVTGEKDPNHMGQKTYETTIYELFKNAKGEANLKSEEWKDVNSDGTPDTFADGTYHTFDMFYLERGGGESNLYIHYNLVSTADFTAHKALYDKSVANHEDQPDILKRDQFHFELIGLDGQYESVKEGDNYVIRPVEGQESHAAIMPKNVSLDQVEVNLGNGIATGRKCTTGVTEDGNVNFGFADIDQNEMHNLDEGHPSVYRYIVLENVPDTAKNAQGHTWGELKSQGNWAEMSLGGFEAIDPMTGGVITYGASDGESYSPVHFMTARVTKWALKDSNGDDRLDSSGNVVYQYGLSKTYYKDASFFDKADNVADEKFIDIRNAWEPGVGSVEFSKVDAEGAPLQGAKFALYTDPKCTKPATDADGNLEATSDAQGKVRFSNIRTGTYYMKEIQAPNGYAANDKVYKVYIANSNDAEHHSQVSVYGDESQTAITSITNYKSGELVVKKQWLDAAGRIIEPSNGTEVSVVLKRKHYARSASVGSHNVTTQMTVVDYNGNDNPVRFGDRKTVRVDGDRVVIQWDDEWQPNFNFTLKIGDRQYEGYCGSDQPIITENYRLEKIDETAEGRQRQLTIDHVDGDVEFTTKYHVNWLYGNSGHWRNLNNVSVVGLVTDGAYEIIDDAEFTQGHIILKSGAWSHVWTIGGTENSHDGYDLPAQDANGKPYLYYVAELDSAGNEISVGDSPRDGYVLFGFDNNDGIANQGVITVYNKSNRPTTADVQIFKVDQNSQQPLEGARFYIQNGKSKLLNLDVRSFADDSQTIVLDADGCFELPKEGAVVKELEPGQYTLVEAQAPDGYILSHVNWQFEVLADGTLVGEDVKDGLKLTIPNTLGSELPVTGGIGTTIFTVVGVLLIAGGALLLWRRRK